MICRAIQPNSLRHGSLSPLDPLFSSLAFSLCCSSRARTEERGREWKPLILCACVFHQTRKAS